MRVTDFVAELYDPQSSFRLDWDDQFGPKEIHARAYDRQGGYLDINFVPVGKNITDIEFSRNDSFDITGGGDASRVFATVLEAIKRYLSGYRPKYLIFSAKGGSRYKLYQSMVARYAGTVGYKQFDLNRLKPETRERIGATGTNVILLYDTNYDKNGQDNLTETDDAVKLQDNGRQAAIDWIKRVYDLYPDTFQNNHVMSWGQGDDQQIAMFELVPSMSKRGAVEVKWFQAYPLRQGVGSRAMQELQRLAKESGITLTLYPWDKGQVSQSKLMKFYRGQGFRPVNKGSKNMSWTSVDESEVLAEGATSVLYHKTGVRAALEIITSGLFKLTSSIGNRSESDMAPPGYPYYLSATRSKVGDYHRWVGSSAVMFVLDGDRISQRYLVKPVDYWERSWQGTQDRTRESEDRIFSRRNTMPSDYITEVHVLLSEQNDLRSEEVRKLLIAAKTKNIPTYLYTDQESWRLQNKRRAKTAGEVGDLLKGGRREPAYMGRPVRGQGRGEDAYGRSDILNWIELIKKQPGQTLSKRADKLRYNLQYYNDEGQRLANDFFNAKKPDSPEYPLVVKLGDWMNARQLDFNSLSELLKNKWKSPR
jgi:hypothetical protein